jgi:predicted acetyltransferase
MANRSKSLRQDCNRLNILMKYQPNFNPNNLSKPCQMYFLVREEDKMAIGMVQIYCGHKHGKNSYVPEVIYEVAPPERGRKYGKVLLNMLLEDKRIDAEWLYFNICKNNEASTGLITSFVAKVVARNDGLDSKTYRLHRK